MSILSPSLPGIAFDTTQTARKSKQVAEQSAIGDPAATLNALHADIAEKTAARQTVPAPEKVNPATTSLAASQSVSGQSYYHAQALGQDDPVAQEILLGESNPLSTPLANTEKEDPAVAEFLEYMKMSPAERIRAQILKEEGLTEEEFAALPPEKQKAILEKIRERIETAMKENTEAEISTYAISIAQFADAIGDDFAHLMQKKLPNTPKELSENAEIVRQEQMDVRKLKAGNQRD